MEPHEKFLFLVVVGGRSPKANIELHDVRWVIGTKIEDNFEQLRNDWFGYIRINKIDSKYFKNKKFKKLEVELLSIN